MVKKIALISNEVEELNRIHVIMSPGRRSVGWMLARSTGSRYMSNPPRSLVPLRDLFDNTGGLLRRAYFSIGMYAAAHDVLEVMYRYPVVMAG